MERIVEFLKQNPVGYFATLEGEQPRVRPFGFGYYERGRVWFCTNNTKKVSAQLKANPYAEVCFSAPAYAKNLRISGHVVFDGSPEAKRKVMDCMPGVKSIYKSPDNPIFEVFFLEKGEAVLEDFPPNGSAIRVAF